MKWGGGNAEFQLLYTLDQADLGIENVKPAHGSFEQNDARLLVPGDPDRSMIFHRMTLLGLGRMPHVASKVVHEEAVDLLRQWISGLPTQARAAGGGG